MALRSCFCWDIRHCSQATALIKAVILTFSEERNYAHHSLACTLVQYGPIKINTIFSCGPLNVSLFQAIAFSQIIELIIALLTGIENPHWNCINIRPAHCRCGAFPRPTFNFIWQIVHFLFELEGGLLQWWEQAPSLEAQRVPFALLEQRVVKGFMYSIARPISSPVFPCHSLDSWPPPLVIEAAQDPPSLVAVAPEESGECTLELLAGTGVDHRVDAAVEVAQPKDHLEYTFGWFKCWEEGT